MTRVTVRGRAGGAFSSRSAALELNPSQQTPEPERGFIRTEEIEQVIEEVNALPELDRTLIAYRYFLDLSTPEIAELLNTPPGTVRSRLSRAVATLRSRLNAECAEPDRLSQRSTPNG